MESGGRVLQPASVRWIPRAPVEYDTESMGVGAPGWVRSRFRSVLTAASRYWVHCTGGVCLDLPELDRWRSAPGLREYNFIACPAIARIRARITQWTSCERCLEKDSTIVPKRTSRLWFTFLDVSRGYQIALPLLRTAIELLDDSSPTCPPETAEIRAMHKQRIPGTAIPTCIPEGILVRIS
jgi:hypothetical protein